MRGLLGEEYDPWLESYGQAPATGIRINPAKLDREEWERICPWKVKRVPWNENGYYGEQGSRPAKDVYYYGGLYYVQEPSAMAPAAILKAEPGQRVLDLCAAPGGKSTELGARLSGKGLLVANDISASRANALLKNLEMAGIGNVCVTAEEPETLAKVFGEYFDKILVDAPCSGEGMFRKEPELVKSWTERGPECYVPLQREILRQAVRMLKPGGELVYSTCTFSVEENEGTVDWILEQEPKLELVPVQLWNGASGGTDGKPVIRLFPHKVWGEGHFAALLRKRADGRRKAGMEGGGEDGTGRIGVPQEGETGAGRIGALEKRKDGGKKTRNWGEGPDGRKRQWLTGREAVFWLERESDFSEWEKLLSEPLDRERMMVQEGQVYVLPEVFDRNWHLRFLRTGLFVGSIKRGRFEPSQAMAMTLHEGAFARTLSMKREDDRVIRYLKGESLVFKEHEQLPKGWVLVCVDRFPLGWAKSGGNGLKNKYYPGWRWQ